MFRFEREILGPDSTETPKSAPAPTIAASTFSAVQEQLSALRAQVYGAGGNSGSPSLSNEHKAPTGWLLFIFNFKWMMKLFSSFHHCRLGFM